jgi:UDP-glucose 4-epimerase
VRPRGVGSFRCKSPGDPMEKISSTVPMKCAVFGGGGFIGSAICDHLLQEGHSVRIFERPKVQSYRAFDPGENVEWMEGDMLSEGDLKKSLQGMDVVFHLVSTTLPKNSNEDPIYDVESNLVGSLRLLETMVAQKVGKIIFISSGGTVYGSPEYLPVDEKHPTNPTVSYGITKLAIEKYLRLYRDLHGIKPVILRVSNPFGAKQRIESVQGAVTAFIHKALGNEPIEIWGDGSVTRDYLHVSDVAEAFVKALDYQGDEMIFNVSSGTGTSLNDLVAIISGVLGCSVEKHHLPGRDFDVPVNLLGNDLAARELGWRPRLSLEEGIRFVISELKKSDWSSSI